MKIGNIGGVKIVVHPAMPVLIVALACSRSASTIGVMFAALALHEICHAVCARGLGVRVEQIELMPFGGAVRLEGFQALAGWRGAAIAAAGPLANALAVMTCATLVQYEICSAESLREAVACNLALMGVNLIPALPMDGGRIACAALASILGDTRARHVLSSLGCGMGGMILVAGVWTAWRLGTVNLTVFLMGSYLIYAAVSEYRIPGYRQIENMMGKQRRLMRQGTAPLREVMAYRETPVYKLAARFSGEAMHRIGVVDERAQVIGTIDEAEAVRAMIKNPMQNVGEILEAARQR